MTHFRPKFNTVMIPFLSSAEVSIFCEKCDTCFMKFAIFSYPIGMQEIMINHKIGI